MQDRWAMLLSRFADPRCKYELSASYIDILRQLSPIEAKVLEELYCFHPFTTLQNTDHKVRDEKILEKLDLGYETYNVLLSNLLRLGLIEEDKPIQRMTTNVPSLHTVKGPTELTDLGYHFVRHLMFDFPPEIRR